MKKGFTLLEMVVVISIIAILLLLTIPRIQTVFNVVASKGCEAQLKIIDTAILEYMIQYDKIPTSVNQLVTANLINEQQKTCQNGLNISIINGEAALNE